MEPYRYQWKDDQDRTPKAGESKPPVEEIKMISGELMVGEMLKSLRKAQGREINCIHLRLPPMKMPKNDEPNIIFLKRDGRGIREPMMIH